MTENRNIRAFPVSSDLRRVGPATEPAGGARTEFDLVTAVGYVRRRIRLVFECIVIAGGISVAAGFLIKPTYTSTALLAVAEPDAGAQPQATDSAIDTQVSMLQTQAFAERVFQAFAADPSLAPAASSVAELERKLKVMQASKSRLIMVSYSAKTPGLAADAANKIARLYVEDPNLQSVQSVDDMTYHFDIRIKALETQLSLLNQAPAGSSATEANERTAVAEGLREEIGSLKLNNSLARRRQEMRRQTLAIAPPVQLVALAPALTHRSSLNPLLIAAPGVLLSALLGVGLALTLGRFDDRIYTRDQLERLIRRTCAGEIPQLRSGRARRKAAAQASLTYRRAIESLVARVVLLSAPWPRLILLAPADANAHGSQPAQDFAAAAARISPRVLLVDLDFCRAPPRRSLFGRLFGRRVVTHKPDVFDVLAGRNTACEAIDRDAARKYHLLPLRRAVEDDPFSLIASERLQAMFDELASSYDLILVDAPPMSGLYETQIIATLMDAALIFVRAGSSREASTLAAFAAAGEALGLASGNLRLSLWAALVDAPGSMMTAGALAAVHGGARNNPGGRHSVHAAAAAAHRNHPLPSFAVSEGETVK